MWIQYFTIILEFPDSASAFMSAIVITGNQIVITKSKISHVNSIFSRNCWISKCGNPCKTKHDMKSAFTCDNIFLRKQRMFSSVFLNRALSQVIGFCPTGTYTIHPRCIFPYDKVICEICPFTCEYYSFIWMYYVLVISCFLMWTKMQIIYWFVIIFTCIWLFSHVELHFLTCENKVMLRHFLQVFGFFTYE